ncbi:MAG TPA: nitrite reductase small subunit NirD [Acetobacteraceae bacterium]|nr:nitrite reductase small subunit NirD [Acetobacteraceae bacterium]
MNAAVALPLAASWHAICALEDMLPESGAAALVDGKEVAVFRVRDAVFAIGNHDPASGANVLSRGIVGDIGGEIVVASPIYKQHFSLITGRCLEEPRFAVPAYMAEVRDGLIWVRAKPVSQRHRGRKPRLIVVGNGMAAVRAIEELQGLAPQGYDITVFGAEPHGSYNRVLLSPLLSGEKRLEDIVTHPPEWYAEHGITLHREDPVTHIDRVRRCVRSRNGIEVSYDRLLIATGSLPILLPVPGSGLPGVITFRVLQDVDAMLAATRSRRRAVVIGGGLLGLEAASGLLQRGLDVTVVHLHLHLMEQQLDAQAADLLRGELERRGLKFKMAAATSHLCGETHITGVGFADGTVLPADLVVMAVGVRPNVELARTAGLPCDLGLLVDDTMLTNDPAVYAIGECVQHRGKTFGLVAPLLEQARVCAAYLAERGTRGYRASQPSTQLRISGIHVFSAGNHHAGPGVESLVLRDPKRGIYKRLVIEQDKIRGAVLYGDVRDSGWYLDLMNEGRNIQALRDQLLFGAPQPR